MKKTILIISALAITLTACKKDTLTREQLQEELANQPTDDLANWELLVDGSVYKPTQLYTGSNPIFFVSKLSPFNDYFVIDNAVYTNEYTWFNGHHSLYLNLDTNLMNTNYFSSDATLNDVLNNPSNYPYLSKIYGINKYNDVLDFLYVDSDEAIFYSRTLDEYIQTYRFN